MKYRVRHSTKYSYSDKVFLEPHHLYFTPLMRHHLRLTSFDLKIDPEPSGLTSGVDVENNLFHQLWFNDLERSLHIDATFEVEVIAFNPFNFLVQTQGHTKNSGFFDIYLKTDELNRDISQWTLENLGDGEDLLSKIISINKAIKSEWSHALNYNDQLLSPVNCFESDNGSCRDLSWMMINMLRELNIPARFVSGYAFNPELEDGHELHAWVEAWINGPGWVGLDPSAGLLIDEHYIPVCASHHPALTLPVQGSYRGNAKSTLETKVDIAPV